MAMLEYLLLLTVKVVVLCSDDLWVEEVGRITHNALSAGLLNNNWTKEKQFKITLILDLSLNHFEVLCVSVCACLTVTTASSLSGTGQPFPL